MGLQCLYISWCWDVKLTKFLLIFRLNFSRFSLIFWCQCKFFDHFLRVCRELWELMLQAIRMTKGEPLCSCFVFCLLLLFLLIITDFKVAGFFFFNETSDKNHIYWSGWFVLLFPNLYFWVPSNSPTGFPPHFTLHKKSKEIWKMICKLKICFETK